jgi:hypothetical protein
MRLDLPANIGPISTVRDIYKGHAQNK